MMDTGTGRLVLSMRHIYGWRKGSDGEMHLPHNGTHWTNVKSAKMVSVIDIWQLRRGLYQ